jgi:hypothetical protein
MDQKGTGSRIPDPDPLYWLAPPLQKPSVFYILLLYLVPYQIRAWRAQGGHGSERDSADCPAGNRTGGAPRRDPGSVHATAHPQPTPGTGDTWIN